MLKIPQARLQQYVNCELPDIQAGFRKRRGTRANCQNLLDHGKSKKVPEKIFFRFIDYNEAFECVDHNKLEYSEGDGNTRPPDLPPEKSVGRSRSNRTGHGTTNWFKIGKGVR